MTRQHLTTLSRWIFGAGMFALSFWCAKKGYHESVTLLVLSLPLFVFGVIAWWSTIFHLATRPFLLLIDSIFFPGGKLAKPTLNLKLPAYYINEERYDEALTEYRKILKHYPDEPEAYEKAIWLWLEIFDEPGEAKQLLRRARRRRLVLDERVVRMAEDRERNRSSSPSW